MEKKTKLTISGGIAKKSIQNIDKTKNLGKNSVIIKKKSSKFSGKSGTFKQGHSKPITGYPFNKGNLGKLNFKVKSAPPISDFERRK